MYYVEYRGLSSDARWTDCWTRMSVAYDTYDEAYQAIKVEQANDEKTKSSRRIVWIYRIVKTEVCYTTEI